MNDHAPTPIDGVMTIGVPVFDQDRALEFFVDRLGFEKRRDMPCRPARRALDRGGAARR